MKSKLQKHIEAGTVAQFRARQEGSRAGRAAAAERRKNEPREPTLEERVEALTRRVEDIEYQLSHSENL